ncbi:alpha-galactosidase [Flavobacteriaceae bacterium TP-CH-4]|uniref:Alpha-galactosidase n=1 Tax=Pelagihabitans pacificus TaxID=2696054 RepID=A0A967AVA2_9FLAO|nr:glycoside hydrolase family 36 protein [Pelagihabitans pacificus]NHF60592.1 alpha-galactosidase [Pelagihabitans pacificus]
MTRTLATAVSDIDILGVQAGVETILTKVYEVNDVVLYDFQVSSEAPLYPKPITLGWKVPAFNVKGVWKPTADFSKRIQADWELDHMQSRISVDAPVIGLFGNDDSNLLTFACSDPISTLELNARLREEDKHFHYHITFFSEPEQPITDFKIQLRLDYSNSHFSKALDAVSKWWEGFEPLKPAYVPAIAKKPLYSTWYQFHQNLDLEVLHEECRLAHDLGYKAVIIDDGWQTKDTNRGYDFTGDWHPEGIPGMATYIDRLHSLGMKVALWYSVPFCGKKSKAYQRFKGKFLTEDHRWAPVFDPRYPEVRDYLISVYKNALKEWKLDGFKLDFIDDFRLYQDTPLGRDNGRDYASINEAVNRLMSDVMSTLRAINPEIFIEFRQKYIGPAMRKYGNMFRAFDCPGDATMNRVRIADIRMLAGDTAVHGDMITWHPGESVEVAALQLVNTLFGVPQLSVMLQDLPASHRTMIRFYTSYWNTHGKELTSGDFVPRKPLANYPIQKVAKGAYTIIGVYDEYVVTLEHVDIHLHLLNAQIADRLTVHCVTDFGSYLGVVYDCQGTVVSEGLYSLSKGLVQIWVPPCGMVQLRKNT